MGRVEGKVALVTGAGLGLGLGDASMVIEEGARVLLTDVNVEAGQKAADALGENAAFAKLDVSSPEEWASTIAIVGEKFGGLDVLVNNAGIGDGGTIEGTSFELWQKVHKVDLDSVFFGCKYALPYMREDAPSSIVNISSIAAPVSYTHLTLPTKA